MELVSRMSVIESATDSPPLSSQFVSEISGVTQDIPKTIPIKRSTADEEKAKKEAKAKAKVSKHSKHVLRKDSVEDTKTNKESSPKDTEVSSANAIQDLFFFSSAPITHSGRNIGYGSYPFGSKVSQSEKERSNAVIDYAIKTAENEPYMITAAPLEKKKELWEAALKSDKFRISSTFPIFPIPFTPRLPTQTGNHPPCLHRPFQPPHSSLSAHGV